MDDLGKIWSLVKAAFLTAFKYLYYISVTSPVTYGYGVLVVWLILVIYSHRRAYYIKNTINIDDDIDVSYGRDAILLLIRLVLKIAAYVLFIVGVFILWRNFLPNSFDGFFRIMLPGSDMPR